MTPDEGSRPIDRLVAIMATLRSEQGCPWDREQTLETLKPYCLEEAYEVLEAIDSGDVRGHCEELGDLLLQVVFQAQLRREEGAFDFDDVATAISDKLVRRHPHVFGEGKADTPDEVVANWDAIKRQEKEGEERSILDGVPAAMPALLKAQEMQKRAARAGFDWPSIEPVFDKLEEELGELREAIARNSEQECAEELGDLLFSIVNLSRHLNLRAEEALQEANRKFRRRFQAVEHKAGAAGVEMKACDLERLDAWWDEVKAEEDNT